MKKSKNDQNVQRKPHPEEDDPANNDSSSESDDQTVNEKAALHVRTVCFLRPSIPPVSSLAQS
jgi:hypothetical protein